MPSSSRNNNANKNKCGELFLFSKDHLTLICDTCGSDCYTLEAFGAHMLQDHAPRQVITTCIKREDSSIDIKTAATPNQMYVYDNQRTSRQSCNLHHEQNGIEKPQNLTANKTKYGEILQISQDNFSLVCVLCGENYYTLAAFGVHILQAHPTKPASQSASVRIKWEVIENPEFESINLKANHDIRDFSDSGTSEPIESEVLPKKKTISKSFQCSFCDKMFPSRRDWVDHVNKHTGGRPYECYLCHKAYYSLKSLKSHLRQHNDRPHKCLGCEKSFIKRCTLVQHFRENHLPATDPRRFFPCKICDKKFKTYSNMRLHVNQHKPAKPGTFTCDYCQKIYPTRKKIVRHMPHHVVREKIKCGFCDKMFSDRYYLKRHEKIHSGSPTQQCQICLKFYAALQSHMKNIHSDERKCKKIKKHKQKRPHQCKVCKQILATSSNLKNHIKIHTSDRQYKCSTCNESFFSAYLLKVHKKTNHLPDKVPQRYFSCKHCDAKFLNYSNLCSHKLNVHTMSSSFVYICDYCQKEYKFRRQLVRHMLKHFSKTTHKCTVCDKVFNNTTSLNIHNSSHGTIKKFQCELCDKYYKQSSGLSRHVRRTHKKNS